jgi:hypothetical protein
VGDLLKGIEYLGIPMTVAIVLVSIWLILHIIGFILDIKKKAVPEIINIRGYIRRKKEDKQMIRECKELLSEFNAHYNTDNITKRNDWMNGVNNSVKNNDALIEKLDGKIDKLLADNESLKTQLHQVKSNVLENEADRLRSELFDCGNRCRRNIRLHPEEMDHIREVYHKYSVVLKQNGPGEKEFNFITDYYNRQDFPTYHQPNN